MQPRATVAICTHNRCLLLAETLTALLAQETESLPFKVLVIDNASTDTTAAVVRSVQGQSIPVRYVYEANLGVAYARNRALEETVTPILVYLDDDTIPTPNWLTSLLTMYDTIQPTPSAVGGKILLRWDKDGQPAWMPDQLLGLYSHFDCGPEVKLVKRLNGGNVSFRTDVLRQYHYDLRLGVKGTGQVTGEDMEILIQLSQDGHPIYYTPQAIVYHAVGPQRLNKQYLLSRSRGNGRARAIMLLSLQRSGRLRRLKLLWWMLREIRFQRLWLQKALMTCLSGQIFRDERQRVYIACKLAQLLTFERETLRVLFFADA